MSILGTLAEKRFKAPAYVMLREVRNATGWAANRSADALVVSCWPSHGLWLGGIEQKVSRGDWLRELKQPAKAHAIMRYCAHWWVVTPPGIVREGELPANWGLIEVDAAAGKTTEVTRAPKLEPEPVTLDFVCALLRNHAEGFAGELAHARSAGHAEASKKYGGEEVERLRYELELAKREAAGAKAKLEGIQKEVYAFERSTGASVISWNREQSIETYRAAKYLMNLDVQRMADTLRATAAQLELAQAELAGHRAGLDRAASAPPASDQQVEPG